MRTMPFRTASDDSVEFSEPRIRVGEVLINAGDPVSTWDYLTEVSVIGNVKVSPDELLGSTGLSDLGGVSATLQVDCPATGFRNMAAVPVLCAVDKGTRLQLDIRPHTIAGEIEVRYGLVLEKERENEPTMAPFRRGSRVYTAARIYRFLLEGDGAGFPTEAFDFEPTGYPTGAPWHLSFRADSLDEPFMGAVRLFINTQHSASTALLAGKPGIPHSVLFHGVLEQLLVTMADRSSGLNQGWAEGLSATHDEGSVGAVMNELTSTYLNMTLPVAMAAINADRDRVLTKLRETAGLLDGAE